MSADRTRGKRGFDILRDPYLNKDTAFTHHERMNLRVKGLVPVGIETLELQARRCQEQLEACDTDMSKYIFLQSLQDRNRVLFCKVLRSHPAAMMPIVYAPLI